MFVEVDACEVVVVASAVAELDHHESAPGDSELMKDHLYVFL